MAPRIVQIISSYGRRAGLQFLVAVANFLLIQTTARALPVAEFGFYSLVLVANAFVLQVFILPVTDGINRFYSEAYRDGLFSTLVQVATRIIIGIIALIAVIFAAAALIVTRNNMLPPHVSAWIYPVTLAYFALYALGAIAGAYFNASANYTMYTLVGPGTPILAAIATFLLKSTGFINAFTAIGIQAAAWAVVLAVTTALHRDDFKGRARNCQIADVAAQRTLGNAFVQYIRPTPWLALATFAFMFGDRIMVAKFFSLGDVGLYSYMYVITTNVVFATFTVYATTTYLRAIEQLAASTSTEVQKSAVRQFAWLSLAFPFLFLPLAILYLVVGQDISILLFGPAAKVPSDCLAILLAAAALNGGAQQLALIGNLLKRQHEFILPRWSAIGLLAAAIFVYHPTLTGVAQAVLFANAVYFLTTGAIAFLLQKRAHPPAAGTRL